MRRERQRRQDRSVERRSTWGVSDAIVSALLLVLSLLVYAPIAKHGFVNYDDNLYVYDNLWVKSGLSFESVRWALTAPVVGNWHPLTVLSHMLDVQLYGLWSGGHHLTSLTLHIGCALCLFALLKRMTCRVWLSGFVAMLFAVHPLNVQSVAWIAERKNLLSTLFWLLALHAYLFYLRKPSWARYAAVFGLFVLGLMSKPMIVTLPVTLLLVDYAVERGWLAPTLQPRGNLRGLLLEKVPMLLASAGCGVATLWAQTETGAIRSLETISLPARAANAIVGYVWYVQKMVWPTDLGVFYPNDPGSLGAGRVVLSAVVLVVISTCVWWYGRSCGFLTLGWSWYLVTLLPVIGIVQVGGQAHADRYAYVPLIGLFVMVNRVSLGGWMKHGRECSARGCSCAATARSFR